MTRLYSAWYFFCAFNMYQAQWGSHNKQYYGTCCYDYLCVLVIYQNDPSLGKTLHNIFDYDDDS